MLCPGYGHPKNLVHIESGAVRAEEASGADFRHLVAQVHLNAACAENTAELFSHAGIMGDENVVDLGEKMKR